MNILKKNNADSIEVSSLNLDSQHCFTQDHLQRFMGDVVRILMHDVAGICGNVCNVIEILTISGEQEPLAQDLLNFSRDVSVLARVRVRLYQQLFSSSLSVEETMALCNTFWSMSKELKIAEVSCLSPVCETYHIQALVAFVLYLSSFPGRLEVMTMHYDGDRFNILLKGSSFAAKAHEYDILRNQKQGLSLFLRYLDEKNTRFAIFLWWCIAAEKNFIITEMSEGIFECYF